MMKCWDYIASDDEEVSEAAAKCLYQLFRFNGNSAVFYGDELPSKLVLLFNKEKIDIAYRNLFLKLALSTPSTREICINEELTDILLSKAREAPDPDSLASILEIIIDISYISPSIREQLPDLIASIEENFCVENSRLYFAFLNSVYIIVYNSESPDFLCSFCEATLLGKILSSLSIDNMLATKIIINIMHAMIGKGNNIHCSGIHQALVGSNVFSVIRTILNSDIEELYPYCYNISAELFSNVEEFRVQYFSSELPRILVNGFPELTTKAKKSGSLQLTMMKYFPSFWIMNFFWQ